MCTIPQEWIYDSQFLKYWGMYGPHKKWEIKALELEEEANESSPTLTVYKLENWHGLCVLFEEREKLRWVLNQQPLRLKSVMEGIRRKSKAANQPLYEFEKWLKNKFVLTDSEKQYGSLKRMEFESKESFTKRVEVSTKAYRKLFGGSTQHNCGPCERNEACDICGVVSPLDNYAEYESGEQKKRWKMRCSNILLQDIGLHVCGGCGLRYTTFRMRQVEMARKRRDQQNCSIAAKKKYEAAPDAFPKFTPVGGGWKGIELQLVVTLDGVIAEELNAAERAASKNNVVIYMIANQTRVVSSYSPGVCGVKKSNGCTLENRERVKEEKQKRSETKKSKTKKQNKKRSKQSAEPVKTKAARNNVVVKKPKWEVRLDNKLEELERLEQEARVRKQNRYKKNGKVNRYSWL